MIIHFTGSLSRKSELKHNYKKIIETLESCGHQIRSDHILKTCEEIVNMNKNNENTLFQQKVVELIEESDCLVAETSYPSVSVGYEIGIALQMKKPILILHKAGTSPPSLFSSHQNENVVTAPYLIDSLHRIINEFLSYVETLKDVKFTFYISSKQARHLKTISRLKKISQSAYLRNLIEKDLHVK